MLVPTQASVLENLRVNVVKLAEPKSFLKVGDIGELDGQYFRLDAIDDLRHMTYFTKIKIHKLIYRDGCVEVVE